MLDVIESLELAWHSWACKASIASAVSMLSDHSISRNIAGQMPGYALHPVKRICQLHTVLTQHAS